MSKFNTVVDTCLLTIGTTWSIANLEQMLGIIILFLNILWLSIKLISIIVKAIKNKKLDSVTLEELSNISDTAKELISALKSRGDTEDVGDTKNEK